MSENHIELKSVNELLNMNFFIPNYQRGYRWTTQQVKDLLNDVNEFAPKQDDFYCIQPLVVKRKEDDIFRKIKDEAKSLEEIEKLLKGFSWEVIDGQQRLTTILIILSCLGMNSPYQLEYETRKGIENCVNGETDNEDNIDFYHVSQAKKTITNWLNEKDHKEEFKEKLLNRVKFIWYQTDETNPIKVFTRLNIGKISLTNAELIKALFLNSSNFGEEYNSTVRLRQQEIAAEWDRIEYTLQNNDFWLFLHKKGYSSPTRIDFIFDLMCEQNILGLEDYQIKQIGTDSNKTFRYFYEYFTQKESSINKCWEHVKTYFGIFVEWFNDVLLYHYVGFLIACDKANIKYLIKVWKEAISKISFLNSLKEDIKKVINDCPPLDHQYKIDGSDKGKCKPILLFHNIQTIIDRNINEKNNDKYGVGTFYKFPFHLYKLENWDVEHINSNTDNDETDPETQAELLLNIYLSVPNDIQEQITQFFSSKEERKNIFEKIKSSIPKQEVWTQEEKNRIWNYTLLDSSTNRSYGNSIFSAKRRIIIGKDKGKLIPIPKLSSKGELIVSEEKESISSFVPPCTKQVFMKYYSSTVGENNYWTKEPDAIGYLSDIRECINKL